ncbi:DUF982 domain-containing protein [Rhizobium sp. FY34]|uniref:DUF982 domain-containing protein n=1 Tax=Rhizobium sp. FY34 TaxID=2562309 RepID=UPI0010C01B8B|nr:DUF982 domain-containing protein [Rhizobium sp. FY34]
MAKDLWVRTVTIELSGESRDYIRIESTRHAASVLLDNWPGAADAVYREAIIGCTQALKGEIPHDVACARFLAAARAAQLEVADATDGQDPADDSDPFELEMARTIRETLSGEAETLGPVQH